MSNRGFAITANSQIYANNPFLQITIKPLDSVAYK